MSVDSPIFPIAVVQVTASDDILQNLEKARAWIAEAKAHGARAVFFPENFAYMQTSQRQLHENAEKYGNGVIQGAMVQAAKEHEITTFAGTMPIKSEDPERVFNASIVYGPAGTALARYNKMHLFDIRLDSGEEYMESAYVMSGSELVTVETDVGHVGLSVCYDLRFPELYRQLVSRGSEVLLVPSAFAMATGEAHWEPLLRARAIENFCYVIAAAQVGKHTSGRVTYGHSIVINPWGEIVARKPAGEGIMMAEIDHGEVVRARRQMPSLSHRKL